MRSAILILALLACALEAQGQGPVQLEGILTGSSEVPPNNDPTITAGSFWLTDNSLSFRIDVPAVTFIPVSGYIQGPALPGTNAPVIFDLGGPVFHSGNDFGAPPYYAFFSPATGSGLGAGPFTLTAEQISQLKSGQWYVNITSYNQPDGQLRGQILPAAEPARFSSFAYTNNQLQFLVTGKPGCGYIIQASTDLTSWTLIQTNTSPFTFIDTALTNFQYRFYRAVHFPLTPPINCNAQ